MLNNKQKLAALAATLAATGSQAAIDVAPITAASTDIAAVGVAVFGVFVAIHLVKWIRRAL